MEGGGADAPPVAALRGSTMDCKQQEVAQKQSRLFAAMHRGSAHEDMQCAEEVHTKTCNVQRKCA